MAMHVLRALRNTRTKKEAAMAAPYIKTVKR